MKKCEKCGSEFNEEAVFCENCGNRLKNKTEEQNVNNDDEQKAEVKKQVIEKKQEQLSGESQSASKKLAEMKARELAEMEKEADELKVKQKAAGQKEPTVEKKVAPINDQFTCARCGLVQNVTNNFCEKCGHKQGESYDASKDDSKRVLNVATLPKEPRKPLSKKAKIMIGSGIGAVILLAGGYAFGKSYYSLENQATRFAELVKENDPAKLASVLKTHDPNYKVNKQNLTKYTDYYADKKHKKEFSELVNTLNSSPYAINGIGDLSMQQEGSKFLFFDNYNFYIEPVYLELTANQKNIEFKIDDEVVGKSDSDEYQMSSDPLTPGEYDIEGALKGQKEKNTSRVNLVRFMNDSFQENTSVNMAIQKVAFDIISNTDTGDVLLDGEKVGELEDGEFTVKDKVWHQGMTVQISKTLPDESKMTTDKREIGEYDYPAENYNSDYSELNLDLEEVKGKDDIQYELDNIYNNFSSYTDDSYGSYNARAITDLASHFENGQSNAEFIDFDTFINSVRKAKSKDHLSAEASVEEVQQVGDNTYEVRYLIEYTTVYKDSDQDSITQIFRYKKATFIYDEEDQQLKIRDLGGTDNFEVVDDGN
ncbi:TcaA second domain-containing protein [Vagococcus intermedius]|uniref:TcaA second domain-containing protein n=1 Tax=Vagococcus intermedius TaxID=2991418 RepID=A0AAF0CVB0_9ENTE|nr:hypothetical protein [Vagococcus intermedius]WEG73623.1 hypothetical protein OL234_01575 [Vagococcus intermedius]WEG75707.1 hypothetical protein OL235_01585 [Vagococcus intermedius]